MNPKTLFTKPLFALAISLGLSLPASANMLLTDLSSINAGTVADREWTVNHKTSNEVLLECVNCSEQVLVNIRLGNRNDFGGLGPEAAKKAKHKCNRSLDQLLQCDTILGFEVENVAGLMATKKVLDDFYISSVILGDETSLIKMTTKASSKYEAGLVSRQFFDATKSEMIIK